LILHTQFVLREEKWMAEWFGEPYLEYKKNTKMVIVARMSAANIAFGNMADDEYMLNFLFANKTRGLALSVLAFPLTTFKISTT